MKSGVAFALVPVAVSTDMRAMRADSLTIFWRFHGLLEAVSVPRFGEDVFWTSRIGFDFLAQLVDQNSKVLTAIPVFGAPNRFQQCTVCERLTGVGNKKPQQIKLFRREVNDVTSDAD